MLAVGVLDESHLATLLSTKTIFHDEKQALSRLRYIAFKWWGPEPKVD